MLVIAILLCIEILTVLVLKDHFYNSSKPRFYIFLIFNIILSSWLWYLFVRIMMFRGFFDMPENVNNRMTLTGLICGVIVPRVILIFLHYSGKLIRIGKEGHLRWLTQAGFVIAVIIFYLVVFGSFIGRYNFKTDEVIVKIKNLPPQLSGLKIVQLSDMHLASFVRHQRMLQELTERVNSYKPDLIINTGDFVSYGWREFGRCDTILVKAKSRYGNFAVLGNHDLGTYMPNRSDSLRQETVQKMYDLMRSSGYSPLLDENTIIDIRGIKVCFIGVITSGRFPGILHGDLKKAMANSDSAGFKILLAHDPNQWDEDVTGKTDIPLTFSGHTHGMQMGILTKKFRWSPSRRYYPRWNGLYSKGDQNLYVNRGLGVLAIPFRIWMPPEITLLTLQSE